MKHILLILCALFLFTNKADAIIVVMKTNFGDISIQLNKKKAPITVKNFLRYVDEGFYNDTLFHRVIPNVMIQGGKYRTDPKEQKPTHAPIANEAKNGLKNSRGTIAMARTMAINSATMGFFINVKDNDFLNHNGPDNEDYGYAVFGKVIQGMDVVDAIATATTHGSSFPDSWVLDPPVKIISITRSLIL